MDGTDCPDLNAILDEIYTRHVLLPVQPGEFTVAMFRERTGLTHAAAEAALKRAARAEDVVLVKCGDKPLLRDVAGHPAKVYRVSRARGAVVE